ncbi:uncharacterized protein EV154DRAFT_542579 [Mucor mucedo]|uniref:CipC-like antibiotic response protein n=1 Tax=Mucor saturninus TaxID=64648 RepID=A0A8H7V5H8_9FUNG|nr:uncharacterized protein EV154DRAFT_542579 [Mucor mucedo]KAG2202119.1 hypothetical protein INT47_008091 [Mucor saturninus]KAI7893978.1 hypothetical protein EV154DRAFT_542579 [Mucor mucedo]
MTHHEEAYNTIVNTEVVTEEHKQNWTHGLLASAAGFAALRAYNKKQEEEGNEVDHALAKELLAGLSAGAVDNLVETKGMDWFDKHKAKKQAEEEAQKLYSRETGYNFD